MTGPPLQRRRGSRRPMPESRNRRPPEASLLLLKASGQIAHGGGKRMEVGSDEYKFIRRWVTSGMPFGEKDDPIVQKISVYPDRTGCRGTFRWIGAASGGRRGRARAIIDNDDANLINEDAYGSNEGQEGRFIAQVTGQKGQGTPPRP